MKKKQQYVWSGDHTVAVELERVEAKSIYRVRVLEASGPYAKGDTLTATRAQLEPVEDAAMQVAMRESSRRMQAHRDAVRLRRFGRESTQHGDCVQVERWAYTLDEKGGETGYIARVEGRTLGEIEKDLWARFKALDVADPNSDYPAEAFIDESFATVHWTRIGDEQGVHARWPDGIRFIACFAVTGGSEGHYVHVDAYREIDGRFAVTQLFIGKTFRGMAHAQRIANLCAELLGA